MTEKTLSDKIYLQAKGSIRLPDSVAVDDLKQFIKEVLEEMKDLEEDVNDLIEITLSKHDLIDKMKLLIKAHTNEIKQKAGGKLI